MIKDDEEEPKVGSLIMCRNPYKERQFIVVNPARVEKLHTLVWDKENGACIDIPTVEESRNYAFEQKASLHPSTLDLKKPMEHAVYISDKLFEDFHKIWNSYQKVKSKQ